MKLFIFSFQKKILLLLFILTSTISSAQTITVNDSGFNAQQLVDLLLASSCATTSNISLSSSQSVAYFNGNGSTFPINEGIIIRSGIAANSQGIYTGNGLDSQVTTAGDPDLQAISNQSGQTATITDAAFLEFDFVPSSNAFSFNFLFASNEYGEWQCGFSDVFAFLLTDLTTGITTNLAVVPGTSTPISVRDIRDNQYNSSCNSVNPNLFSTYNVNDAANSTLNMRGHTVVLNASSSSLTPNNPYRIKLVIGDYNDSSFDSAVFIEAGSFSTTLDLGPDLEICDGDDTFIDSGYTNTTDFSYRWERDGNLLAGENNPSLNVTQAGTYELIITTLNTGCELRDQVVVNDLQITDPNDLLECDTGALNTFNLTLNDETALGIDPDLYDVFYYASPTNAMNNIPINNVLWSAYPAVGGETIYIRIQNTNTGNFCNAILDFNLSIAAVEAATPDDFSVCENEATIDLPQEVQAQILNGLDPLNYTINYFTSLPEAQQNLGNIPDPAAFPTPQNVNSVAIWARLIDNNNPVCFDIVSFTINLIELPLVDTIPDQYHCTEYTLPALTNGNYFSASGGNGTMFNAGDVITGGIQLFIYNTNSEGCENETSFGIFMADEYDLPTTYCGEFVVPSYPNAQFYTEPNGPNGIGNVLPTDTVITTSQTIYFYALDPADNSLCIERQFSIVVNPLPIVEQRDDVITCDSYTLPAFQNAEQYFTGPDGTGTELFPGDAVTSDQTVYLLDINFLTGCTNETSFDITIIDTNAFQDLDACGSYTIPATNLGGYFTQPMGGGSSIVAGTVITSSQTVFYYAPEVTTLPNCTDNIQTNITINPIPPVDSLDNVLRCIDDPYELPPLTNGQYFTDTGGQGMQLNAGDIISTSQTIYIYNTNAFCDAETNFNVEIRPFPAVDNFTDIFSCEPFTLPVLANGQYFSDTGGQGVQLNVGDVISTTQIIYIYNTYPDLAGCTNENVFTVNILGIEVDEPNDVDECDSYTLPPLTVGNYYTESGGLGTQLNAGDVITTTQTLFVYAENGTRFLCTDEHQFTITIFETPVLPTYNDLESCESLTLPDLSLPGNEINYYRQPGGVDVINPSDYTITDVGTQTIYVRANVIGNPNCFDETSFQITVYPLLDLVIQGGTICIDAETGVTTNPFLLQSGLNPNEFTVNWYFDDELVATGPDYSASVAGTYRVETIKLTPDIGPDCNYAPTEVVVESSSPRFEIEFLTNAFSDLSDIQINTLDPGAGTYQFSYNNGPFQMSNTFTGIPLGTHTITVRDETSICGDIIIPFTALDHPSFFTPNDDGVNDTWNIPDLRNNPEAIVRIYNRLGRLVAVIRPAGLGWNGQNSSGKREPSADYWFEVEFMFQGNLTKFRSNFSLLRR